MKKNKVISILYLVGLQLFSMGLYAAPTAIVSGSGLLHIQLLDSQLQPIYVTNMVAISQAALAGKKVKFTQSTRQFTDESGTVISGLQGGNSLGMIDGKYKVQYMMNGASSWQSLAFDDEFYVSNAQVGAVPGAKSSTGSAITIELGSGEKVSDIDLGFEFTFGGDTYFSTNSIASLSGGSAYINSINAALTAGKDVTIKTTLIKKSGSSGTTVWGATVSVESKGTSVLSGGSVITIDTLKAISMMGGGTAKTPVLHGAKLAEKSVGYITNNMKSLVMVSEVDSFTLSLNPDITVAVPGSGSVSGNDTGTGTSSGLKAKLTALGSNPSQSAVVSAIQAYATAQGITLNATTWTGVISPALASASLSSMASSIKTALNIGEESLQDKLTALGSNPSLSTVESTIKSYYNNNMTTIRSDWSSITTALTNANLSSKIASLKPILDKKIKVKSGESAGGRF